LNDLESHSPVARFFECNLTNIICSFPHGFNLHSASRGPSGWSELYYFSFNLVLVYLNITVLNLKLIERCNLDSRAVANANSHRTPSDIS